SVVDGRFSAALNIAGDVVDGLRRRLPDCPRARVHILRGGEADPARHKVHAVVSGLDRRLKGRARHVVDGRLKPDLLKLRLAAFWQGLEGWPPAVGIEALCIPARGSEGPLLEAVHLQDAVGRAGRLSALFPIDRTD